MKPIISIVMPLYNAGRFLEETLISVSKQAFQDYELICVDDGSDDHTIEIVQSFQKQDSRIRLFGNEKHSGAAVARNLGMKAARGKYLVFLDGDDVFDKALLSLTHQKAEDTEADIVIFEAKHVPSERIGEAQFMRHSAKFMSKFTQESLSVRDIKVCDFLMWPGNLGTKLFRRKFIEQECLEFQNLSCENDTYFVMMAFFLAKRIVRLDVGRVMLYARDHDTPSRISSERDPMCIYHAMLRVRYELEKRGIFVPLSQMYYYRTFFFLADSLKGARSRESREKFYSFLVNEGFNELFGDYDKECYIDQYIQEKKWKFVRSGLEEGWDKLFSYYDVFLKDNLQELRDIFYMPDGKMRNIGVWGTGENGRKFLAFCKQYGLPVYVVIDRDETKYGGYCEGYFIQSPQAVKEADTVISTPNMGYDAVKDMVQRYRRDIEVIDLNSYICWF